MRRRSTILVALVASTLLLASCTSPTSQRSTDGRGDQVLTIARPEGPQTKNHNPFASTSSAMRLGYGFVIYEPMVQFNTVRPTDTPIPWLASAFQWNADYTKLTYTVRDGVTWSDGVSFTAEDVAYNFQIRKGNDALNTNGVAYGDISTSGNQVTLTFPYGQYVHQWEIYKVLMVPKHIWEKVGDPTTDLNTNPIGTGPYVLDRWTDQGVDLKANPTYWGGSVNKPPYHVAPAAKHLRFVSYTDNASLTTALAAGEVQLSWNFIADYKSVYLDRDPKNNHVFYVPSGMSDDLFLMNLQTKPFNNKALRQALNVAHNRKKQVDYATSGVNPPITNVTGVPTPGGEDFIAPEYKDQTFKSDVTAAKKILTDAGYTYSGNQLIDPDGKRVTVTLTNPTGWSDFVSGLEIIAETLRSLGVDAKVETPDSSIWTEALQAGNFQGSLRWTDAGPTPWSIYNSVMDADLYKPIGQSTLIGNFGRYQNPAADAALKEYANASSDSARQTAMAKIQKIWIEDVPAIAIDARPTMAEYSTQYYTGWPDENNPYCSPEIQQPALLLTLLSLKPVS